MSAWRQLRVLLLKEFTVMRRSKTWTVFEIAVPLLIALPLLFILRKIASSSKREAQHFPLVRITGDWHDLIRPLPALGSLLGNCMQFDEFFLGLVFPPNMSSRGKLRIAEQFRWRYSMDPSLTPFGVPGPPFSFNMTPHIFSSEQEMVKELQADFDHFEMIKRDTNTKWRCPLFVAGIIFTEFLPGKRRLAYTLRLRRDLKTRMFLKNDIWSDTGPFESLKDKFALNVEPNYWELGLLTLQYAIDSIFLQAIDEERYNETEFIFKLRRMPEPAFYEKSVASFLSFLIVFWQLFVMPCIIHTVSNIVSEKGNGMKAYLKVMGLNPLMFYISHAIIACTKIYILLLICSLILATMLVTASPVLFIITSLIYGAGAVSFALLMSTILNKEGRATKGVAWIWLFSVAVTFMPLPTLGMVIHTLLSLNLNFAFSSALHAVQDHMSRDVYLGWKNMFEDASYMYPFGVCLLMMCLDVLWMLLLCIYLDNVFPGGDLPRKPLLYFLQFMKKHSVASEIVEHKSEERNEFFEKNDNPAEADIEVHHLLKLYGCQVAVNDLSFSAHRGEITVLLGDNGAGKSTTFSIITGLNTANSGTVLICGTRLDPSTAELCQRDIGYCPQYNPLFNKLTVYEHLDFFRQLRDTSAESVDEMIAEVQLSGAENTFGEKLSGGMKRKLCVGISLIGDSRVILLDEPTAGMDPRSRHAIVDLLRRYKRERTILLTTHYMDEADLLGDRIHIMVRGQLFCSGTSKFLKKRFNAGYLLAIGFEKETTLVDHGEKLLAVVRTHIPNAELDSATSRQLIILLPSDHKEKFAALFANLEERQVEFGINSFGVSLNTLEQVFLKISEIAEGNVVIDIEDEAKRLAGRLCEDSDSRRGCALWGIQFVALFNKRLICCWRQWPRLLTQIVLPIILFAAAVYFTGREPSIPEKVTVKANRIEGSVVFVQSKDEGISLAQNVTRLVKSVKKYKYRSIAPGKNLSKYLASIPKKPPPLGLAFEMELNETQTSVLAYFNAKSIYGPVVATTFISNARLGDKTDSIRISMATYGQKEQDPNKALKQSVIITAVLVVDFALLSSSFVSYVVDDRDSKFVYQLLTGLPVVIYWITIVLWDIVVYAFICAILLGIIIAGKWLVGYRHDVVLLWVLYLWPAQPFIYSMAFLFDRPTRAYVMSVVICLVAPICVSIASHIVHAINEQFFEYFHTISLFFLPTYGLSSGMLLIEGASLSNYRKELYKWENLTRVYFMLTLSGLFFWTILIVLNSKRIAILLHWLKARFQKSWVLSPVPPHEDRDVTEERRRVFETPTTEFVLAARDLNKYYGEKHAVKNLTFGIGPDECFGLLGINGAGKTTTFDMLTGISIPDAGHAYINGRTILKKQEIGFCPQFDALHQELTARETLRLMASLCGFSNPTDRVETLLEAISLTSQADRCVKYYSGGQKRRLSVAVALVSHAHFIILDEPTAGIDPKTRRRIWNLLSAMRELHRAMLLTSHSMDECDALCSRIGVLDNGTLIVIGSPQYIKSRFGEEYTLSITIIDESNQEATVKEVEGLFPDYTDKLLQRTHLSWHIRRNNEDRWSVLYGKLAKLASTSPWIIDYSLAQASLEEAFLRLARSEHTEQSITPSTSASAATLTASITKVTGASAP